MTAPQTVADVLDAAADLLEKPGAWTQGHYARGKSGRKVETRASAVCFCILGAVSYVNGSAPNAEDISTRQADAIRKVIGDDGLGAIPRWNDAPGCTQSEVVAALRAAATSARQENRHGE